MEGSRWAGNRLTADRLRALDYVAHRLTWPGHTGIRWARAGLRADGLADARDTTRWLLASAGATGWLARAGNTADRAEADRLADQSCTGGGLASAGLRARWLTRTGVTADSLAAIGHRADRWTAARCGAHRLTASGLWLTNHWLAGTRHSADS